MSDDRVVKSAEEWRRKLSRDQYHVCREKGTELPFTGEYCNDKRPGVYHCVCCGNPLFTSRDKYDSGTGWPSFLQALAPEALHLTEDSSHGMRRTEATCARCDAHLGHVFDDGPRPTGKRYCINSVALRLLPDAEP